MEMQIFLLAALVTSVIPPGIGTNLPQNATTSSMDVSNSSTIDTLQMWKNNYNQMKASAKTLVKTILPYLMSASSDVDVSDSCRRSIFQFLIAFRNLETWALHMLDASSKGISGILSGSVTSLGSFDQCLKVRATGRKGSSLRGKELFTGQYCNVRIRPRLPPKPMFYSINKRLDALAAFANDTGFLGEMTKNVQLFYFLPFRFGVCVPSSCSAQDVQNVVKAGLEKVLNFEVLPSRCEIQETNEIKRDQIPVIVIFSFLILCVICGTCFDYFGLPRHCSEKGEMKIWVQILFAFSARRNLRELFDPNSASEKLMVLHGIRVFSISWIVLGHTFYYLNFSMIQHLNESIDLSKKWAFTIVSNSSLVVDNFFFISGLLVVYVTLDMYRKTGKNLNVLHYIFHRLWRFLPIQMAFVGITLLLPWIGSGPLWHETIDPLVEGCRNEWWTNLLFINNLYRKSSKGCVSHSWYLAADLQIYLLALFVLIPLIRKPRIGLAINFAFLFVSALTSGLVIYLKKYPPTVIFSYPDPEQRTRLLMEIYYPPYQHLGPFCIGMFIGYCLESQKRPKKIHPIIQITAWLATLVVSSSILFGIRDWSSGEDFNTFGAVLYASLSRISWTLTVAWITFACSTGYGGILNSMLTWKPLIPLSRLTFMLYMSHPFLQQAFYGILRNGVQAQLSLSFFTTMSVLGSGYVFSVLLCIFLESPFLNLGKIIYHNGKYKIPITQQTKSNWKTNRSTHQISLQDNSLYKTGSPSKVEFISNYNYHENNNLSNATLENATFVSHL